MPGFNGLIAMLTKGSSTGGVDAVLTGISVTSINSAVPAKHFRHCSFGILTQGASSVHAIYVVGAVGGATYTIFGKTGIGDGSLIFKGSTYDGLDSVPRPSYVSFESAKDECGFTSSVFMAGEY